LSRTAGFFASVFRLGLNSAHLDLGFIESDVEGFIESDGDFEFESKTEVDLALGDPNFLELAGDASVKLKRQGTSSTFEVSLLNEAITLPSGDTVSGPPGAIKFNLSGSLAPAVFNLAQGKKLIGQFERPVDQGLAAVVPLDVSTNSAGTVTVCFSNNNTYTFQVIPGWNRTAISSSPAANQSRSAIPRT